MDQELRNAIRLVKRSGGGFSQLDLHEMLNQEDLASLIHHCVIARLQLIGLTCCVSCPETVSDRLLKGWPVAFDKNLDSKEPRTLYKIRSALANFEKSDFSWPLEKLKNFSQTGPRALEELPHRITTAIYSEWSKFIAAYNMPISSGAGHSPVSPGIFKNMGICAVLNSRKGFAVDDKLSQAHVVFRLVEVWTETPEAAERFRNKKLREMGLLPGRKR